MNDYDLAAVWTTLKPTDRELRRIDARVLAWLEARDTPLAAEWVGLFRGAPVRVAALVAVGVLSIATSLPLFWVARALM